MAGSLHVELVAADRLVWSGEATTVIARTTEGDVGILPGHAPFLGLLTDGVVEIRTTDGGEYIAAVHGGFLSIADDRVSILAELAELAHEIDLEKARIDLDRAHAAGEADIAGDRADLVLEALRRAEVRVRAAERVA